MTWRSGLLSSLLLLGSLGVSAPGESPWRTFASAKYHFTIQYPGSWYSSDATDILDITNFRRSLPGESIALTVGGAEIHVAGAPPEVHNVNDWILRELPDDAAGGQVRETDVPISNPIAAGCVSLKEVTWRERVAPGAYFAETAYYCSTRTALYKIALTNWDGDRNQARLMDLALKIALSLKVQ